MKTLSFCREAGFNCDYIVKGETDEEILNNSQQHAMSAHGMKVGTFTTQYKDKLKGLIKDTAVKLWDRDEEKRTLETPLIATSDFVEVDYLIDRVYSS